MTNAFNLDAAIAVFRECLAGLVFVPGDDGYQDTVTLWNRAVNKRPAIVARCQDEKGCVVGSQACERL